MQRSNAIRGFVFAMLFSALLYCAGCIAYKRAYVAIHDSIDEVIGETNKVECVK